MELKDIDIGYKKRRIERTYSLFDYHVDIKKIT